MIVGAGVTWIPGYLWRLDGDFKAYAARETPWLVRLPSEQFLQQVRVATYSTATGLTAKQITGVLQTFDGLDDTICFASGYPRWDTDRVNDVSGLFPSSWCDKILSKNADAFFRWTPRHPSVAGPIFEAAT
jgi:predicted TIM-barrel fold metal-dependent hydrolase